MAHIEAIIFDLDGVLVDSAAFHRAAFEEVLRPFGVDDFEYSEYAGWRTAEVIETVLRQVPCELTPGLLAEVAGRKSQLAREKLAANPIDPTLLGLLDQLASRYVLALASSGSLQSVELFLASNRCRHLFQSVLSGESVCRAKPDPEIYQRTFSALSVSPGNGVVVEDAIAGIVAAKMAGAAAVIGMSGTCTSAQLLKAGADDIIQRLDELPDILSTRYGDQHR